MSQLASNDGILEIVSFWRVGHSRVIIIMIIMFLKGCKNLLLKINPTQDLKWAGRKEGRDGIRVRFLKGQHGTRCFVLDR